MRIIINLNDNLKKSGMSVIESTSTILILVSNNNILYFYILKFSSISELKWID